MRRFLNTFQVDSVSGPILEPQNDHICRFREVGFTISAERTTDTQANSVQRDQQLLS